MQEITPRCRASDIIDVKHKLRSSFNPNTLIRTCSRKSEERKIISFSLFVPFPILLNLAECVWSPRVLAFYSATLVRTCVNSPKCGRSTRHFTLFRPSSHSLFEASVSLISAHSHPLHSVELINYISLVALETGEGMRNGRRRERELIKGGTREFRIEKSGSSRIRLVLD